MKMYTNFKKYFLLGFLVKIKFKIPILDLILMQKKQWTIWRAILQ